MKSLLARLPVMLLIGSFAILFLVACGDGHHAVTLVSIAVTPTNPSIAVGATKQFTATGTYSDNSMKDITGQVTWASGTTATATISTAGLATAVAGGTSAITASLNGITSPPDTLTVTAPTLVSIQVTPVNPTITTSVGTTLQFTATGTYSDSTTKDITATVTWASATPATATISAGGLATPVAGGTSVISATQGAVVGKTTLTVAAVTLVSIRVTPANPTVGLGQTVQFTATGTFSDNSTKDITSQVTWASATMATATISSAGLATPVSAGTSVITAVLNGVTSTPTTTLTVTAATLVSIAVTPTSATIAVGAVVSFTAIGTYSAGPPQPLAGVVTWSSGTPATASINSTTGLARGLAVGTSAITATAGGVTSTPPAQLTVKAATSRFAYSGNPNTGSGTISIYAVNPASGAFSNRGYVHDFAGPGQVIPDLSGQFAYALEGDATIKIYNVNAVTGNLTLSSILPAATPPQFGSQGLVDPTGRFLYVANLNSSTGTTISAYSIDLTTGGLTALTGSPYPSGNSPLAVVTDSAGKFLYSVNSGDKTLSAFAINPNGSLTPLAPFTTAVGAGPGIPAVDSANHLFVPNGTDNTISAFTINADGSLTAVAGSPFGDTNLTLNSPGGTAVDPAGKYLFVSNFGSGTAAGTVSVFSITPGTGALSAASLAAPAAGLGPTSVSVDPGGAFVAVTNNLSNNVSLFSLNETTGALTPTLTSETGQIPLFTNLYLATAPPTIAPAAVYAANSVSNNISAFTAAPATGVLTPATPSIVVGVAANGLSATDLAGNSFYTAGPTAPGHLAGFSVTQATAALAPLTSSPASLSGAVASTVLADPSERFVYVVGKGVAGSVLGYDVSTGALTPITGSPFSDPSLANLNALAMDPQGQFVFALRTGFVGPVAISAIDGHLAIPPSTPATGAAGSWTAGAVDSSGQFLLALDSAAKTIQAFAITAPTGIVGTDGLLTAAGLPVSVGGTLPSSIAIDPLDRFVFVTDATANTITVFSFNVTTGGVVQIGSPVSVPSGAGQAAVDASGTYLYVALAGAPGTVAAFTIGSTGTLTLVAGSPFPAGTGTSGTLGVAISNSIK